MCVIMDEQDAITDFRYYYTPSTLYCTVGGAKFLENLNLIVAQNLKRMRDEKKLSLEKVADLTGVSKTMLSQIERGESNPTISTVWKIANGLKTSFTSLIDRQQPDTVILHKDDVAQMAEDNGRYRIYPFFPYEDGRRFESYMIEIEEGGSLSAEAHSEGTQEFITVFDGALTVRVGDEEYTVSNGSSIRFKSDRPHAYYNHNHGLVRLNMVIYYSK